MKKKIIFIVMAVVLFLGAGVGEFFILRKIDHDYQENEGAQVFADIALDLNMIKTATIAQDADSYRQYFNDFGDKIDTLKKLPYVMNIYSERIDRLEQYFGVINEEAVLMDDLKLLKDAVGQIAQKVEDNYSDVEEASDDGLSDLQTDLEELKASLPAVSTKVGESIRSQLIRIIDESINAADETDDCLNECYSEKMEEITDDFKDELNSILEENTALNNEILQQFRLDDLDSITSELTK